MNDTLGESHDATCKVIVDKPRTALAETSEAASLVAVGARGLGGFCEFAHIAARAGAKTVIVDHGAWRRVRGHT